MDKNNRSLILALLAILFWSTIASAFKVALKELTPGMILLIASLTSVVVLFIIVVAEGSLSELKNTSIRDALSSAGLALLNPFIYYLVLLKAYTLLPAQVAQPLNMIWPIVLVVLSAPLLKQKIPLRSYLAMAISFSGVYIVSSQGELFNPGKSDPIGILLAVGSSIFWALYFIFNLRDHRRESVKLLTNFVFASIYISLFLALSDGFEAVSFKGFASSIYIGVFEMGLTFYLWLTAMKLATTSDRIANLVFLAPFLSLLFISIILDEKIYLTTPAGLLLIVSGIIYQNYRKSGGTQRDKLIR
jgi:drug/metabolite transporter (DMT)-like permease